MILDAAGNLYGTTSNGGTYSWGTVFKVDATGTETILYNFASGADGANPAAGLVRDSAGNLYGTTSIGGTAHSGTIFKLARPAKFAPYFRRAGRWSLSPVKPDERDAAGNLYGNTGMGGTGGYGVVFKYDTTGNETVLHSFGGTDGEYPLGTMVLDKAGHIYGSTQQGGSSRWGTVFTIVP